MNLLEKIDNRLNEKKKGKKFGTSMQKWYSVRMKDLKNGMNNLETGIKESNPQEIANSLTFLSDFIETVMIPPIKEIENIKIRK